MRIISFIVFLSIPFLLFSQELLVFPNLEVSKTSYVGCDKILRNTPMDVNFSIYGDTLIELNKFDKRLDISFKFNWDDKAGYDRNSIAVLSIELIKNGKIIDTILLKNEITLEAFPDYNNGNLIVRDDIYLTDINMDSYLDLQATRECGKGCYNSYWIYNPSSDIFEHWENINYLRPFCFNCEEMIIYSYDGATANLIELSAYKINNYKIEFFQSLTTTHFANYFIHKYFNQDGTLIHLDTIKYSKK